MSTEKGGWENTEQGTVGEQGHDGPYPLCLVLGQLREMFLSGPWLEQLKTVISETEDNGQPHSGMEFLCIIKRPVPKEVIVNESQVTQGHSRTPNSFRSLPDNKTDNRGRVCLWAELGETCRLGIWSRVRRMWLPIS